MGVPSGPARPETATFQFLQWSDLYNTEKPFQIFMKFPEGTKSEDRRATNIKWETKTAQVTDCRPNPAHYSLDEHGFKFCMWNCNFQEFTDREAVTQGYLPRVEQLIRDQIEDVDSVFFFDWRLRRHEPDPHPVRETLDLNDPTDPLNPVVYPHVDQAPSAVVNRIRRHLPEQADELLKRRVRVINVWRPLNHPVEDWPLALCDGSTINAEDLVEAAHIRRSYHGSTLYALYLETQKWHYLSGQRPDEVTIFKNFDSSDGVRAKWAPHASFLHSRVRPGAAPRESIEVRALVFSAQA